LDLPASGGGAPPVRFTEVLAAFLRKTPLTDLATAARTAPEFRFSPETLSLVLGRAGRTLALRAMQPLSDDALDPALGRAVREVLTPHAASAEVAAVLALLAERMLSTAQRTLGSSDRALRAHPGADGALAQIVGARAVIQLVGSQKAQLPPHEWTAILAVLQPLAQMPLAEAVAALVVR